MRDFKIDYKTRLELNIMLFSGLFIASKYAIPYGENRHSAHRRKVANLLNSFRASIGPKSKNKNRISNTRRENKPKNGRSTAILHRCSAIQPYFIY